MNKNIFTLLLFCLLFLGCQEKQTLIVTPSDINKSIGKAEFYDGDLLVASYDVLLGRSGVSAQKREGDGNTPSGEYEISAVFGKQNFGITSMPFIKTSKDIHCVDDINSEHYNKIIDSKIVPKDYVSFEEMLRDDGLYDMGSIVKYNHGNIKGLGSCIFLHIKSDKPTAGCISMDAKDLKELLLRLDSRKNPTVKINP